VVAPASLPRILGIKYTNSVFYIRGIDFCKNNYREKSRNLEVLGNCEEKFFANFLGFPLCYSLGWWEDEVVSFLPLSGILFT
jgi:hypothetical protein